MASTRGPIGRYVRIMSAARSFSELRGEIESLPYLKARGLFLEILALSDGVGRSLEFEHEGASYPFLNSGWGSPSMDYRGLCHCSRTIDGGIELEIDGRRYRGGSFQMNIYSSLSRLMKLHLPVRPNDKETRVPWGRDVAELP